MIKSIDSTILKLLWLVVGLPVMFNQPTRAAEERVLPKQVEFNRDIRPILSERCFTCHGPDAGSREADLRLDQRDAAIEASAIVPGEPEDSEIWVRMISDDEDYRMPPPGANKSKLDARERELLRPLDSTGSRVSTTLVADAATTTGRSGSQECVLVRKPDRLFHSVKTRISRPHAFADCGSDHAGEAGSAGCYRPAAES